jgi:hypothetical protein
MLRNAPHLRPSARLAIVAVRPQRIPEHPGIGVDRIQDAAEDQ